MMSGACAARPPGHCYPTTKGGRLRRADEEMGTNRDQGWIRGSQGAARVRGVQLDASRVQKGRIVSVTFFWGEQIKDQHGSPTVGLDYFYYYLFIYTYHNANVAKGRGAA